MALRLGCVCMLALVWTAPPAIAVEANLATFETRLSPSPLTDGTRINIAGEGHANAQGGMGFVGDFDRRFRAFETATGKTLWQTRLATSVQGHAISYAMDGKQHVAVETGLGGGSPVDKPATLMPQVHHPNNGAAIFVFALPDN